THDPGMYPKRVIIADARLSGVPVLPLDVNRSDDGWKVEHYYQTDPPSSPPSPSSGRAAIRVSLREVKGISDAEVERVAAGQPSSSLRDFWERAGASRPVVERMVLIGAFDSLYADAVPAPTRRDLLARVGVLDRAARIGAGRTSAGRAGGTALDLFGAV